MITGAAGGLGVALAQRFARERPKALVLVDLDQSGLESLLAQIEGDVTIVTRRVDVTIEEQISATIEETTATFGSVDVLCQNAGSLQIGGLEAADPLWEMSWSTNVMAHVYGARAALPGMAARGEGWLVNVCSAAGLLTDPAAAPYAVSKHAAVALAEWLAINYRDRGVNVLAVCPQGVDTPMLTTYLDQFGDEALDLAGEILAPSIVADAVLDAMSDGRFLVLPHPQAAEGERLRALSREQWFASVPSIG